MDEETYLGEESASSPESIIPAADEIGGSETRTFFLSLAVEAERQAFQASLELRRASDGCPLVLLPVEVRWESTATSATEFFLRDPYRKRLDARVQMQNHSTRMYLEFDGSPHALVFVGNPRVTFHFTTAGFSSGDTLWVSLWPHPMRGGAVQVSSLGLASTDSSDTHRVHLSGSPLAVGENVISIRDPEAPPGP